MHRNNWATSYLSTFLPKVKPWKPTKCSVVKTISDLFLPVAGEVLEQNPALEENPELVNKDPYGEGWLIKMKPANAADLDNLLNAESYKALVNE